MTTMTTMRERMRTTHRRRKEKEKRDG